MAYGDFNRDGFEDIATLANNGTVSVILGYGDGTFSPAQEYVTGVGSPESAQVIVAGDFNGDGSIDLAIADYPSSVVILAGSPTGTFKQQPTLTVKGSQTVLGLVTADFDGDGKADIATFGLTGQITVLTNTGSFTFSESDEQILSGSAYALGVADVDGDGRPDLVASIRSNEQVVVALNKTGGFSPETPVTIPFVATAVAVADVNGDGKPDVVVGLADDSVGYLLGDGKGGLGALTSLGTTGAQVTNLAVHDVTGDGLPDIIALNPTELTAFASVSAGVWNAGSGFNPGSTGSLVVTDVNGDGVADVLVGVEATVNVSVLLSAPRGILAGATLETVTPSLSAPILVDVNGDGHLDTVAVLTGSNEVVVFLNKGDGTLAAGATYGVAANAAPTAVAAGDFNGDGRIDLAVASPGLSSIGILLGTATGFSPVRQFPATYSGGVVIGDFNKDGKIDVIGWSSTGGLSFLAGSGTGTFAAGVDSTTTLPPGMQKLAAAPLNGTRLDLVGVTLALGGAQYNTSIVTRLSNGDGTFSGGSDFTAVTQGPGVAPSFALGDFNKDGKLDAMVYAFSYTNDAGNLVFCAGDGTGSLTPASTTIPDPYSGTDYGGSLAAGDFDGDGNLDVAVIEPTLRQIGILKGDGKGGLKAEFVRSTSAGLNSIVAGDLAGTGRPSLFFTGSPGAGEMLNLCK